MNVQLVGTRAARPGVLHCIVLAGLMVTSAASASAEDGLPGIYAMGADGANFRLLVKLKDKWNGSPNLSPDGKLLLFDACPPGQFNSGYVHVMPADGPVENVLKLGLGSTPSWSPDGKQIAFYVHDFNPEQAEPGIWRMNADGSERTWLCHGNSPRWSPDGKQLLLVNDSNGEGDQLFRYDLENKSAEPLLDRTFPHINGGAWSPDGSRVALIAHDNGGAQLVIVPAGGKERKGRVRLTGNIGYRPSWSADGKIIACWFRRPDAHESIHLVEVDTDHAPQPLAHQDQGRVNSDPSWSPDGKQILFISDR